MMMFARIFGLLSIAPVYSSESVNFQLRVIITFLTSMILFPVAGKFLHEVPNGMGEFALIIFSEALIGILMGFLLTIIFSGFQMAGEYFSVQMGFGYTEVLDPVSQTSVPVISNLKNLMGVMVFISTGAYRVVIESVAYSFEKIQILNFTSKINQSILNNFEFAIGAMFLVAFKIALPVMGILLLVTIAESIMGKVAPQLNIMQLSFPIKIIIGLFVLILIIPFIEKQMELSFELSFDKLNKMISEWPKK